MKQCSALKQLRLEEKERLKPGVRICKGCKEYDRGKEEKCSHYDECTENSG